MPFKSQQQAKFFYAASRRKGGLDGLSQADAQKFIADSKGEPTKNLPKRAPKFNGIKKMIKK